MEYLHLDPKLFPYITKDSLTREVMLRYAVVPLGIKNVFGLFGQVQRLNLGVMGKLSRKDLKEIRKHASEKMSHIHAVKAYLVDVEALLLVWESVYGISRWEVKKLDTRKVDLRLMEYLLR